MQHISYGLFSFVAPSIGYKVIHVCWSLQQKKKKKQEKEAPISNFAHILETSNIRKDMLAIIGAQDVGKTSLARALASNNWEPKMLLDSELRTLEPEVTALPTSQPCSPLQQLAFLAKKQIKCWDLPDVPSSDSSNYQSVLIALRKRIESPDVVIINCIPAQHQLSKASQEAAGRLSKKAKKK
jgi:hypothetical protein